MSDAADVVATAIGGWKLYAAAAIGGAVLIGGAVTAWVVHGNNRYDDGYLAAQAAAALAAAKQNDENRKHEQDLQAQANAALAKAINDAKISQAAADSAATRADGLQRTIATLKRNAAEDAKRTGTNVATTAAPWDVLSACIDRYRQLGKDADAIVEQFRPTVNWASVIDPTGASLAGWSSTGPGGSVAP